MIKHLSFILLLTICVSGCVKNDLEEKTLQPVSGRVFTASFESENARTYVEEGNLLRWNAGDQISLFDSNTLNRQYQFDGETGDNAGTFSIVNAPFGTGNDLNCHYALYPYASNVKITENGVITATLPAVQSYAENSFGLDANTMVAVTENHNDTFLKFKNVGGYLKLQLYGDDVTVKSIELTGNSNEKIAGKASITPTYNDDPQISMLGDATSCITLNCGEGVKIGSTAENITDFWIVIPPTTFEDGFTITITDINDETFIKSTSNEIAIERNVIKPMKAFEVIFENESEDEGSSNDYIDEYGVNHGPGVEIDGVVWAPVNCGYHATDYPYGKLYQWGRKYGQGYKGRAYVNNSLDEVADATYATVSSARVSLEQGQNVLNKDFYYMSSNYQDWTFESNDQLWNSGTESSPVKTQYDPCPLGWRVPTYLETQSLCGGVMSVNEHGQTGFIFKPQTNPDSDQSIFLTIGGRWTPFGYADDRELVGYYWTSKSASNGQAYYHLLHESSIILDDNIRMYGCSVRCVKDNANIEPITSLTINEISVDILIGQYTYITASISPSSVYDILWQSSDTSIATIDNQSGKIIGVSEGTVTISASAGGRTATCMVNVIKPTDYIDEYGVNHGTGVIIDNVYWAPVNCGYRISMFEYGKLYQWGRKYGQGYTGRMADDYGAISKTYSDWTLPTYASGGVSATKGNLESNSNVFFNSNSNMDWVNPQNDKLWNAGTESEPVKTSYDPCPEGWRVPTESEMEMLSENFSDIINYNGKRGRWFSGSNPYGTDVSRIFLPAAGAMSGNGSYAKARGAIGSYWTSGVYGKDMYYDYDKSLALIFDQSSYNRVIYTSERGLGLSVRCVHE